MLDSLEVGEAHSAYLQAKTQLAVTKADFERAEKLHSDQIIAQKKDHLRAHAEYDKAKASLRQPATSCACWAYATPADDGRAVSTFPLSTPFAGTVIEKHAILGELAPPDKHMFPVADLSRLWIEANLFEKDLGRVKIGAEAMVTVDAYPGESFQGKLTYIAAVVDKETHTVRPGRGRQSGRPTQTRDVRHGVHPYQRDERYRRQRQGAAAAEAVVLMQGQPTAFVAEDGGFEPRVVELGDKLRDKVVIKNGLKAGERVVTARNLCAQARMLKSQIGDSH
ncbi:MAG: efflux RND transporter periplasmic adaptor subunit [Comamonadaceae bacterium]|nr:efflux RND transporter periplasmic adaptor subunit [Comamonadaceae bacterium]